MQGEVLVMDAKEIEKGAIEASHQRMVKELKQQMGDAVDAQLRKGGEEGLTDACLIRWLVARKWVLADAAKDLKAHAEWRASYVPNGRIDEAEVRSELDANKGFQQGYDKDGRPVCIVDVQHHKPGDIDMTRRFITYSLDCQVRMGQLNKGWDGKAIGIFDLSGMAMANSDLAALRAVFDLLQNHYPERLHRMYLYEAPMIFYGLWKLVQPFVDPVTKQKVVFVYKKEAKEEFTKTIDLGILPESLGGTGKLRSFEEAWKWVLEKEAAAAAAAE